MLAQAGGQAFGRSGIHIKHRQCRQSLGRERCRYGTAHAAAAHHQRTSALQRQPLAQHAAHKTGAIKHVALQLSVGTSAHGVACARNGSGGRHQVHQLGGRHLVRHGDQRATDVGEREHAAQKRGVVRALAAHGHHHHIGPGFLEPGVVNHGRLEGVRGEANVGNDFGVAVDDHGWAALAALAAFTPARSASK